MTFKGTNTLNAYGAFEQRRGYETGSFDSSLPEPIDLYYEKPLYGKVNLKATSVIPSSAFMKQVDNVFVLNFVADAFNDFRAAINRFTVRGNVAPEEDSLLVSLVARKGWNDSGKDYNEYMSALFDSFANSFVIEKGRDDRIRNFETFLPVFLEFVSLVGRNYPLSRANFTQTHFYSPLSTGLMIEFLDNQDASTDEIKFEQIINDQIFNSLRSKLNVIVFILIKMFHGGLFSTLIAFKLKIILSLTT
jgi:hypothetical protein